MWCVGRGKVKGIWSLLACPTTVSRRWRSNTNAKEPMMGTMWKRVEFGWFLWLVSAQLWGIFLWFSQNGFHNPQTEFYQWLPQAFGYRHIRLEKAEIQYDIPVTKSPIPMWSLVPETPKSLWQSRVSKSPNQIWSFCFQIPISSVNETTITTFWVKANGMKAFPCHKCTRIPGRVNYYVEQLHRPRKGGGIASS